MKKVTLIVSSVLLLTLMACSTHTHQIGKGAQGNNVKSARTMWVISLVPIVEADVAALAGDATDYTITTQQDFVDILIYGFTSGLIKSRVVKVTK